MPNLFDTKDNIGVFSAIGKTLTATSLGLQGKDPSSVFDDIEKKDDFKSIMQAYLYSKMAQDKDFLGDQKIPDPVKLPAIGGKNANQSDSTQQNISSNEDLSSLMSMIPEDEREARISSSGSLGMDQTRQSEKQQDIAAKVVEAKALAPVDLYNKRLEEEMKQGIAERPGETTIKDQLSEIEQLSKANTNVKLLSENYDEISNVLGPKFTSAPIFRVLAKFTDDETANAFLGSIGQTFDLYRKIITGVQAGEKEIKLLQENVPSKYDNPKSFLTKSYLGVLTTENAIRKQIPVLRAANKSTAYLEASLDQLTNNRKEIESVMKARAPKGLKNIRKAFFEESGIAIAEGFSVDEDKEVSYDDIFKGLE